MQTIVYILFAIFCAVSANVLIPFIESYNGNGGLFELLLFYVLYGAGFVFAGIGLTGFIKSQKNNKEPQEDE